MPDRLTHTLLSGVFALLITACASPEARLPDPPAVVLSLPSEQGAPAQEESHERIVNQTLDVSRPTQQGQLQFGELTEVSGLAASNRQEGVLWAINDSGNEAALYALDEQGKHLGKWPMALANRDWEDLASVWFNGDAYLLIAETGDNLRLYSEYKIHIVPEPLLNSDGSRLNPLATLSYRYSDGKHNVEAMGVIDDSIILISKEPLTGASHTPGKVYRLPFELGSNTRLLEASYLTTLFEQRASVETRLAAALTGVSLNSVTAMDFDATNRVAYLLTYREVIKLPLPSIGDNPIEYLSNSLSQRGNVIYAHSLKQAEAMTVDSRGQIWLTSENALSPLWTLPAP